ncbi:MAG: sporulation protein YqfD [Clostridia bacterium]|nr:sporulation protein YqfD [Clostridia bacterium]
MWQFLKGYAIIRAEGLCTARFLRRITNAGIPVLNVRKCDDASILFTVPAKRFFELRKLRKGLPLRIRIVGRGGLPFLFGKLKRRPVLWIGSVLLFVAIAILSTRIWIIRIDDTDRIDPDEIIELLAERGIRPGARLMGPILITAANDLSVQIHDAAWVGLDREGILLKVNVVEAQPGSIKRTDRVPSDITAERDGVITSIRVMRGQARVKVGDRVNAGDVLISGDVLYKDQSVSMAADGIVYAAVQYRAETDLLDRITESYETDATETVRILRVWDFAILGTKSSFDHYRLVDTGKIIGNDLLPISIKTDEAREIAFRERTLSAEEAEEYALIDAREKAFALVPKGASIINTYGTIRTAKGKRTAVVIVTAEEIIGKTEEVPHDG